MGGSATAPPLLQTQPLHAAMDEAFKPRWTLADAIRPGLRAVHQYWRPFVAIQVVAVSLVVIYRHSSAMQVFCERISAWKEAGGLWFVAGGGVVAGVVIPGLSRRLFLGSPSKQKHAGRALLFQSAYFIFAAVCVDLFYRLQSILFGSGTDWLTVAKKVAFDQLVYTSFFAVPVGALLFLWWQKEFRFAATLAEVDGQFYIQRVVPILIPNFAYWVPMVTCIYSLPKSLQFPLFLLVGAAWNLIFVFVASGKGHQSALSETSTSTSRQTIVTTE